LERNCVLCALLFINFGFVPKKIRVQNPFC